MLLSERLREIRKNNNETLKVTSLGTGISVSYLSDIERGRTNPSLQTLEALATHFNISIASLLHGVNITGEITDQAFPLGLPELLNDKEWANEIDEAWVESLLKINHRGKRPQTKKQWLELYLSLKRILEDD